MIHTNGVCNEESGIFSILFVVVLLAVAVIAEAQQPKKVPRIGYISGTGNEANQGPYVEACDKGCASSATSKERTSSSNIGVPRERWIVYPTLVSELIERQVNVLVAPILPAILAAKQATKTMPIVMVATVDPVASNLVDSLARPGGTLRDFPLLPKT